MLFRGGCLGVARGTLDLLRTRTNFAVANAMPEVPPVITATLLCSFPIRRPFLDFRSFV